jgi:integrase
MADDTGIRQRGDRWQVRVCYEDMAGKRHTLTDTCATKTGARRKRDEFRAVRDSGQNIGTGKETLKAYLETWLTRREERAGLSPLTTEGYRRNVERYIVPNIGGVELRKLTPEHVELLLDALGSTPNKRTGKPLSAQTQQHAFRVLHKALEDALRQGRIASNPCHLVSGPKVERHELATLTAEQVGKLLASIKASGSDYLYMASVLGSTLGLRRGEVLALRWEDVDLEAAEALIVHSSIPAKGGAVVKAPKSEASRSVVPLPAFTVTELKAYGTRQKARRLEAGSMWQDSGLVIENGFGFSISPGHLSRSFTKEAKAAKMPITFHGLRHTFTSLHHDAGTPLKVLQELVRHASPALLLSRYGHSMPGAHEVAAERLDKALREAR